MSEEIKRLRDLIRAVVAEGCPCSVETPQMAASCTWCGAGIESREPHEPTCPWPALVAEAKGEVR